jgi:hypothetical protein
MQHTLVSVPIQEISGGCGDSGSAQRLETTDYPTSAYIPKHLPPSLRFLTLLREDYAHIRSLIIQCFVSMMPAWIQFFVQKALRGARYSPLLSTHVTGWILLAFTPLPKCSLILHSQSTPRSPIYLWTMSRSHPRRLSYEHKFMSRSIYGTRSSTHLSDSRDSKSQALTKLFFTPTNCFPT